MKRKVLSLPFFFLCLSMVLLFGVSMGAPALAVDGAPYPGHNYQVFYYAVTPPPPVMYPGNTYPVTLMISNYSDFTWQASPPNNVDLGYFWEQTGGASITCVWGEGRFLLPNDVAPGQYATVTAYVKPPNTGGTWKLSFDMVHEGITWFHWQGCPTLDFTVTVPSMYKASWTTVTPPPTTIYAGQTAQAVLTVTNEGSMTWPKDPPNNVDLGYFWEKLGGMSAACTWGEGRFALPNDLAPGESATITATVRAPSVGGSWCLKFDMVHEGVTWFHWKGSPTKDFNITVPPLYDADYSVTGAFGVQCVPGGQTNFTVNVTNNGSLNWIQSGTGPNPVNLSYHWYNSQGQLLAWDCVRTVLPSNVAPGQSLDVPVTVTAPYPQGTYILKFDLVQEGRAWFSWAGVPLSAPQTASVPTVYGATYNVTGGFTDPMTPGGQANFTVNVTNTGYFTWKRQVAGVPNPVNLAFHWYNSQGQVIAWDCVRTALPSDVAPGQSVDVPVTVTAPYPKGTYILKFDLVHEGKAWFSWQGVPVSAPQTANVPSIYGATYTVYSGFYNPVQPGALVSFYVNLTNTGYFTWKRSGTSPNPVNLSFHWYNGQDQLIAWDCVRTVLPSDVAPGETISVPVNVRLPNVPHSTYILRFDLVREGMSWFSWQSVPMSAPQTANIQ